MAALVAAQPAAAQSPPASSASVPSAVRDARVVVHLYVEPSVNRMAEWRARIDALKADAVASAVPVRGEYANGFVAWGGTLLVRAVPRIFIGGELGQIHDQVGFVVTEPMGGILFQGLGDFGVELDTVDRNAQLVLAFYPREGSHTHFQFGAGLGQSHVMFFSRRAEADGEGAAPILSASFGTEWKRLFLNAGARFHRVPITYTRDDLGVRNVLLHDPNVDLSGVFVRLGLAFHWFSD